MKDFLEVKNLTVNVGSKKILDNVSFKINKGEVVVLMGPNGAGKSTISNVLMGNPKYEVISGSIFLDGEEITDLDTTSRSKLGLFMSFQHPVEINGVTMTNFLRQSYNAIKNTKIQLGEFMKILNSKMKLLEIDNKFRGRFVNSGFSGGEKKRSEILQLMLFEPKYALLDEIDSGLDVDALKTVSEGINLVMKNNSKKMGILIVTHYNKILEYIKPDRVIILKEGKIVLEGDSKLAKKIEEEGFN